MAILALVLSWAPSGCGAPQIDPERGPVARGWTYRFVIDSGLSRLEAHVCFHGEVPWALEPIDRSGARFLRLATGPEDVPLNVETRTIDLEGLPPDSCVRYVVDLDAAARQRGGLHGAYRIGDDLVASTAVWLWAPVMRDEQADVRARFELPPGVEVSSLWPTLDDGAHRLDERAFRFTAYASFGRLERRSVAVPGACMRLTILGNGVEMGTDALVRALGQSAEAAALCFGRFPVEELSVLAVPTPFSTSSPFGIVGRGTVPTVAILVGERAAEDRLARAWVPVHEFSHLVTPYIGREDAWLSEGIATYYQEVLRARAGLITEAEAFDHLHDGFRRGERAGTGRTLAEESRDMMETAAFRRVYWAGAAIALMADVELRVRDERSAGLDGLMETLNECCARSPRAVSAREILERLDAREPAVLGPIARRWLGARTMPDLRETYRRLGLGETEGGVTLSDDDAAVRLRRAIMEARPELAPLPRCE